MIGRSAAVVVALAVSLLTTPPSAGAQPPGKVYRIGYLTQGTLRASDADRRILEAFAAGLRERGYVEGQHLRMEWREASGDHERLADLAAEVVRLHPDVVVTVATPATQANLRTAKALGLTIPPSVLGRADEAID